MIDEYVQGQPIFQQPVFYPQFPQQPMMQGQIHLFNNLLPICIVPFEDYITIYL